MNYIFKISIIFLVFFVFHFFGMDVKPRKSSHGHNALKVLIKAHRKVVPEGKFSFVLADVAKTEKLYRDWVKRGAFTAQDLVNHKNMHEKFRAMKACIQEAQEFYERGVVAELTKQKIKTIKYAIASEKIVIQVYLQKLAHAVPESKQKNFYYESYTKVFENFMSVKYPQHDTIGNFLHVLHFSVCDDTSETEKKGLFVFSIDTDPFKKPLHSASGLYYECGYFSGRHKAFYFLYEGWLRHWVQEDNEKMFIALLKEDPFDCNNKLICRDQGPILDGLFYMGENAEKYMHICTQHGCKTREEVREILKPCIW